MSTPENRLDATELALEFMDYRRRRIQREVREEQEKKDRGIYKHDKFILDSIEEINMEKSFMAPEEHWGRHSPEDVQKTNEKLMNTTFRLVYPDCESESAIKAKESSRNYTDIGNISNLIQENIRRLWGIYGSVSPNNGSFKPRVDRAINLIYWQNYRRNELIELHNKLPLEWKHDFI